MWLKPRAQWRKQYADWPALKKLEYMDELMKSIARRAPMTRVREKVEPISGLAKTLRQHYEERKDYYGTNIAEFFDADLLRLFSDTPSNGRRRKAATFLQEIGPRLCQACARGTGEHPYTISQTLKELIQRCRALKLYINDEDERVYMEVAVFLSVQVLHYLHRMRHSVLV